ncbi:cytochrome P450 [Dactylosporangium maewongense]|uniref:Cytochrome P450 n=2 Tax=Micromonosporaceae TaxID=28056 RepID=A0ABN2BWB3_9ACTN
MHAAVASDDSDAMTVTHSTETDVAPDAAPAYPLQRECPYKPSAGTAKLREPGPIIRVRLYNGRTAWLVTGPAEVRALLADPAMSSMATWDDYPVIDESHLHMRASKEMAQEVEGGFPEVLFGVDPPVHTRQRKMLLPSFTNRKVQTLRPIIQRIVDERLDAMLAKPQPADFLADFAAPVPMMVVCLFLGVPYAERDFFEGPMHDLVVPEKAEAAWEEFTVYLERLVDKKMTEPGEGLIDDLIASHVRSGELSRDELVAFAMAILMAGTVTTTSAIALGTLALLDHEGQYEALVADPSLVPGAIEEILRTVNLVEQLSRVATADVEIGGVTIKAGDGILLSCAAANLDPSVTSHPDEFDITRPPTGALAFSYGLHHCMGHNLARLELEVVLRTLADRVPKLRPAVPTAEIPWYFDFTVSRLTSFPVTW